jgi:hypothetical protein
MSHNDFVINCFGHDALLTEQRLFDLLKRGTATPVDYEQVCYLFPTRAEEQASVLATRTTASDEARVVLRLFTEQSLRRGDRKYKDFIGTDMCNIATKHNLDDAVEGRRALLFLSHNDGQRITNCFWGECELAFYDKVAGRVVCQRTGGREVLESVVGDAAEAV